jgi:hypothetical protein
VIETVAALLRELLLEAIPELDAVDINHGPTIGQMYEGLSGRLLSAALPQGADLRVVTGFVSDGKTRSGQIDRMIVRGNGTRIPETDAYVWPIGDVIAVVEVKKNLTAAALAEAIEQLETVRRLEYGWLAKGVRTEESLEPRLAMRAFAQMTGHVPPERGSVGEALAADRRLLHTLLSEQHSCLRIVLGLHGHKTEAGLRKALTGEIRARVDAGLFVPEALPQLIVSGEFSITKANGQPYVAPMTNGEWPILFSSRSNPLLILLELVWTRLDLLYGIQDAWGDDLEIDIVNKALLARPTETGWVFTTLPARENELARGGEVAQWTPAFISETEAVVLAELRQRGTVDLTEPELATWLLDRGTSVDQLRDGLLATGLVATDDHDLVIVVPDCTIAFLPDGNQVAADDSTGRLTRWIAARSTRAIPGDKVATGTDYAGLA